MEVVLVLLSHMLTHIVPDDNIECYIIISSGNLCPSVTHSLLIIYGII